jgi:hypothetical protein
MAAEIIPIAQYRQAAGTSSSITRGSEANLPVHVTRNVDERSSSPMTVEELYPALRASEYLGPALSLLREAEEQLADGVAAAEDGAVIAADDAVLRFLALLPELFCCRSLGDSFGTVVNALYHGIKNLGGMPIELPQITAARNAIKRLRQRPFLDYDEALNLVASMEAAGMNVDPPGLLVIGEVLLG